MADLNTTDFSLPAKGHNNPPSDIEILGENLTLRYVQAIRQAEAHVTMANNIPTQFTVENEASYVADYIKLVENNKKLLEKCRKDEKEPFLRQGQYVDSFFGDLTTKLEESITKAKRPLNEWLQRRARAEQAEREALAKDLREQQEVAMRAAVSATAAPDAIEKAVEAVAQVKVADAIAAAPIISMASSKGNVASAGLQMKWVGKVMDIDQLDLGKLRPYIAAAELAKALDRYVKQGGRVCDGAEIKEVMEAKVK